MALFYRDEIRLILSLENQHGIVIRVSDPSFKSLFYYGSLLGDLGAVAYFQLNPTAQHFDGGEEI